jgi:hypothetical protein
MRRSVIAGMAMAVASSVLFAVPANAVGVGEEGCTPGYWKNHTESWLENSNPASLYPTTTTMASVGFMNPRSGETFLMALNYKGGSGLDGAEQILLRAAVSAWLNAVNDGVGYPLMRGEIVDMVNASLGDRADMLAVATDLDTMNNLGCPL